MPIKTICHLKKKEIGFMDSVTKSKIIIEGIIWVLAIIAWIYAMRKIPVRFLIQNAAAGLFLVIIVIIINEVVSRRYKMSMIEQISEWPLMWIGLLLFLLAGGVILRYIKISKTKGKINTEKKK